ncbi:MAG: PepSY protein, partial [Burkholderia sp.]|nr:PepSY protein [Burkholderia sp.]
MNLLQVVAKLYKAAGGNQYPVASTTASAKAGCGGPKGGDGNRAFSIKWQAAPVRVWLDIHKLAGVVIFAFFVMTAVTGSALALYDIVRERALIALTGEGTRKAPPKSRSAGTTHAPRSAMVAEAKLV